MSSKPSVQLGNIDECVRML